MLPDGTRNPIRLQRLKDKLGNRSNASAEIEYDGATGWLVGDEGSGVRTIIDMVNMTRLDCVLGTTSGMLSGLRQAVHHATYRSAFGRPLIEQPAMVNVLADLAVETEAALVVGLRLAGAVDRAARGDEQETLFRRLGLAVTKYWVCKRGPVFAGEALECLGGNGYVEESGMPKLYREMPLMSIWEGSGNVAALDVLRAMANSPASVDALFTELDAAAGADERLDHAVIVLRKEIGDLDEPEYGARRLVERRRCACRVPCWCGTATRPSPTRSARPGWAATGASRSARCPGAWTRRGSWSAPSPRVCFISPLRASGEGL